MLGKLLKYDLKRNMRWLWILFVCTIAIAGAGRLCEELSQTIAFFKVLAIFFDSIFYAVAINTILQPFLRNFLNFSKNLYGDESYLTHTLPVTKNQLINSKYLTATIEIVSGSLCAVAAILIKVASQATLAMVDQILLTIVPGGISAAVVITLGITLLIFEFLMFISIIDFSIVLGYKSNEKKALKSFIFAAIFSMSASIVLGLAMLGVLLIFKVDFASETLILSGNALLALLITGIVVYLAIGVLFYFLAKKQFNKGVNVD